jgi:hypothetical protein
VIWVADQFKFVPLYKDESRFVGAQFIFQGLQFLTWWGDGDPPWRWVLPFYRHVGAVFRQGHVTANLDFTWTTSASPRAVFPYGRSA